MLRLSRRLSSPTNRTCLATLSNAPRLSANRARKRSLCGPVVLLLPQIVGAVLIPLGKEPASPLLHLPSRDLRLLSVGETSHPAEKPNAGSRKASTPIGAMSDPVLPLPCTLSVPGARLPTRAIGNPRVPPKSTSDGPWLANVDCTESTNRDRAVGARTRRSKTWTHLRFSHFCPHHAILTMQNNVCLVIDLERFYVRGTFQPRELGYHSWQADAGRQAFFQCVEYRDLCAKDRRTVGVVRRKIHGLSYQPSEAEDPTHPRNLRGLLRRLYREFATEHRTMVAYKGGTVEKTLLSDSRLPGLNWNRWGAPSTTCSEDKTYSETNERTYYPVAGFTPIPSITAA